MRFVANISDHTWSMTNDEVDNLSAIVEIGFVSNDGPVVVFDNLSFGFDASSGQKSTAVVEPAEGVTYVSTDQPVMSVHTIDNMLPDEEWTINVWAENAGTPFAEPFTFTVPRPSSPYPSWVWDAAESAWVPPVPYPSDEKAYAWNEETKSWDEYIIP